MEKKLFLSGTMTKGITLLLLVVFALPSFAQQDPKYTQYMFNMMGVNAGYAGSREALSIVLTHRSQWIGIGGAPTTENLSIHTPLKNQNMALGLQVVNDKIGPKNKFAASGVYAYRLRVGDGKLALALRAGLLNYRFNWNDVSYHNPADGVIQSGVQAKTVFSVDYAMYYHDKKNYIGLELTHLNQPSLGASNDSLATLNGGAGGSNDLRIHGTLIAGRAFRLSDEVILKPSLLLRVTDVVPGVTDLNISALFKEKLWVGVSLRSFYGVAAIVEMKINDKFRAGLSYDYALNQLQGQTGGSFEVFLGYDLNIFKSKMISPRYF